ncbi:olee1-like protein [Andrographis paniculata]|uniref:olee1-like protein n=1 Tax=Andrographis paniculata TaxID=175694 RepID=UPI0021E861F9|nr:olee1-like protein [Andrographis paniculata]
MANQAQIAAALLVVSALCLISLPSAAAAGGHHHAGEEFYVEGEVYCEVCRVNFINKLSELMSGAKVRLECHGEGANNITYTVEGETDSQGHFRLKVEGDHEEEECAVTLVKSNRADCDEIPDEGWATMPTSRITLTKNNGFHGDTRQANPLGFLKKEPLAACDELIKELRVDQDDDPDHP